MTPQLNRLSLCLCVLGIFVTVIQGDFVDLPPKDPILSLAEEETILPCRYQPTDETLVQVTWYKEKSDGDKEQIITAHHTNGQTAFGAWSRRVRFKSSDPTLDSSLVIMSTEVSDEGKYLCRISTFPSGNFDLAMSLTVWTIPISSLEPVVLVEGQPYRQAASCRSVARPPPRLSWDTDLSGQSVNRSSDNGAVSSHYSLHPLRGMNGKKLDCLVWHPTLRGPRRIPNNLVVHFPPHAEVAGYNKDWIVGMENAALRCVSGGNPKPQSFTWIRYSRTRLPLRLSGTHVTNRLMCLVTVTFLVTLGVIVPIILLRLHQSKGQMGCSVRLHSGHCQGPTSYFKKYFIQSNIDVGYTINFNDQFRENDLIFYY